MNDKNQEQEDQEFISYEEARINQGHKDHPKPVKEKAVKASTNKINPDENSMESRG